MGVEGVLAGLRVLEIGEGAAPALATRPLAEHGATVVRVESASRPDPLRTQHARPGEPLDLDGSPQFALLHPDKWSVSIDVGAQAGTELALRLAEWADVIVLGCEPPGLGPEALLARKPGLVVVTSSLLGRGDAPIAAVHGHAAAIAGFHAATGWPDREPLGSPTPVTDVLAPRYAALLVAAALLERRRTGRGRHIDVSQVDVGIYSLSEAIVRASAGSDVPLRAGNRQAGTAPHGIYPCSGDDAWIAIAVPGDEAWRGLVAAMGSPAWASDPRWTTALGREANQHELDRHLSAWTRAQGAYALMGKLQEAGVPAGVVQDARQLLRDPQLAARRHFAVLDHAVLGPLPYGRSGFRLSESPGGFDDSGPLLGEDDDVVLGEILGLGEAEIARLVAAGVVRPVQD